jgi:glutamate--cysteine ligase
MGRGPRRALRPGPGEARTLTPVSVERIPHRHLAAEIRQRMSATVGGEGRLAVGAEVELIPVRSGTCSRVPLEDGPEGVGLFRVLRRAGERLGWGFECKSQGVTSVRVPGAGWLTFEPGGQIELSTIPFTSLDDLTAAIERTLRPVYESAVDLGVALITRGIDPFNTAEDAALLVASDRYCRQSAHYDRIGPWGRRMMRQSAAIHVNLDLGGRPVRRWSVANRAAPYVTALFANSPRYAGFDAGVRSMRAEQWRHLDPSRTGVFPDGPDPVSLYTSFALDAADFIGVPEGEPQRSFRASWASGAGLEEWRAHLSTLFPEVRPRGYLELRSVDSLRPAWAPVPCLILAGLLYDGTALHAAQELLPQPSPDALAAAGRTGLADPATRSVATQVFDVGLAGARRLGLDFAGGALLERAEEFRSRFVSLGLDPGHEAEGTDPFGL